MSLFQHSVLNKYLEDIDSQKLEQAWEKFTAHFHDPIIQENIRNAKEEQYQGEFLIDLFVNVLGYTKNPTPNFNLTTELKNVKDSKKADGAILQGEKAVAVIELKGTNTVDLSNVELQAFGYKNNQPGCIYVITSNFEKLHFYIDNAVDYESFNLFELTRQRFKVLWLCLHASNLLMGTPKQIKEESLTHEESVTKKLYNEYSTFRNEIFDNILINNPQHDKLVLFKKTQKLLDRFLFIFFAEDRLLLPPNSIREIVNQWTDLKDKYDAYQPLYSRFKKYFGYMDAGYNGQQHDIFAYNGGLFAPDTILDNIIIDDQLLYRHTLNLSNYDYESEVSVNILGHIFEQSLTDIENIQAKLGGMEIEKSKAKRKKDGVFYTPKYITKYIVESTVGELCREKKVELKIIEEDYEKERKGRRTATLQKLLEKLDNYRNWLLQITICDPACGSGAFLNQALEFLISEHQFVDELQTKLLGGGLVLSNVENTILENNLYGVDINEESVDIAKLSLWLRTAKKGRKLTSLSNNIKCGNSLIDNSDVAGDKAFRWEKEFPDVFANGGFDVVIGNPPYLRVQGLRENFELESIFYEENYKSATGRFDIYVLFMEKSFTLINKGGTVSFILPHKFLVSDYGEGIRQFLSIHRAVNAILHFDDEMVFSDASTYTCIIKMSLNNEAIRFKYTQPNRISESFDTDIVNYKSLSSEKWKLISETERKLFDKLNSQKWTVKDVFKNISQGIVSVGDDIFLLKGDVKGDKFVGYSAKFDGVIEIEAGVVKPLLKGEDVKKYSPAINQYYCFYPHMEVDGKTVPYEEDFFQSNYPLAYNYILPYKKELIEKKIRYKTNPKAWYSLHRSREISLFEQVKIITPEISLGTNMTLDVSNMFHNTKCYSLVKNSTVTEDIRFWLAILNSRLLWYYLKSTGYVLRGGYFTFKTKYLEPFPLPKNISLDDQNPLIERVEETLSLSKDLVNIVDKFKFYLQSATSINKLNKKLKTWYELVPREFLKEIKKIHASTGSKSLTKADEIEWLELFMVQKSAAQTLILEIKKIDREIDQMVYALYGLTEDEIRIVEQNC